MPMPAKASLTHSILVLALMLLATTAAGQVEWVVSPGCSPPYDGSPEHPFCTIQDGINAAVDGDSVLLHTSMVFNERINLYGKQITIRPVVLGSSFDTVIDGTGLEGSVITCVSGETPQTIIQELVIRNGFTDVLPDDQGGGMLIRDSSPTVKDCEFVDNVAFRSKGGAIALINSDSLIEGCHFEGNNTGTFPSVIIQGDGGAIYNEASRTQLKNCVFYNNWVGYRPDFTITGGSGGAMLNDAGSDVYIENCRFISNDAALGGGAIHNAASTCEVVGSGFSWNWSLEGDGGADLWNKNSNVIVTNCSLIHAAVGASAIGSSILNDDSHRDVTNTILSNIDAVMTTPLMADVGMVSGTVTYSYIRGGFAGIGAGDGILDSGVLFAGLQGADAMWGTLDDNFKTLPMSSTTDAGDSTILPGGYVFDLEGGDRILDACVDPKMGVGNPLYVDIGATEIQNGGDLVVPDDYPTIQQAIDAWNSIEYCGGIMVRPGTYLERINLSGEAVTLRAEFPVSVASAITESIIDGESLGTVVTCDSGESYDTVLEGLVITGGYVAGGGSGGGVRLVSSSPTIRDCEIRGNWASHLGGGLWSSGGNPLIEECSFINNIAGELPSLTGFGGAVHVTGWGTFSDCSFSGNQALGNPGPSGGMGGAIDVPLGSAVTLERCTFTDNQANDTGGAVFLGGPGSVIEDCHFARNDAWYGGALTSWWSPWPLLIESCRFVGNTAQFGGALSLYNTNVTLAECEIIGNDAGDEGGALWVNASGMLSTNSTFSENAAGSSGDVAFVQSGTLTIDNSIVWGSGGTPFDRASGVPVPSVTSSDVEGISASGGNINADPLFVQTPSSGFDGNWGTSDDDPGDLRLSSGSPCIDAGDNTLVSPSTLTDADGNSRFFNDAATVDTGVAGGAGGLCIVDMGAYEFGSSPVGGLWEVVGLGVAGTAGTPSLVGCGELVVGGEVSFMLTGAAPSAPAWVILGFDILSVPFLGGVLVPTPDLIRPLPLDSLGGFEFSTTWSIALSSGSSLFLQIWIQDAGGPEGFAASNGVTSTVP